MSSSVLLDFDGVLIKNKHISHLIETKSIEYIQKKYNKSMKASKIINTYFYKTFGHTAIGVNPEHYQNNILEYNEFVFDNIDYQTIDNMITLSDKLTLRKLNRYGHKRFGLFTNAPIDWCQNICALAKVDLYDFVDEEKCFTSNDGLIKPKQEIYQFVEDRLSSSPNEKIHFIDDNIINFKCIIDNEKWQTHHLDKFTDFHSYYIDNFY